MSNFNLKSVILGVEATRGTPPAATAFYKLPISGDIGLVTTANSGSNNVLNGTRLANEEYLTTKQVSGTIAISADYSSIYFPLALGMGIPATVTDNSDGTYTRVFTPLDCIPTVSVQSEITPQCGAEPAFYDLYSGVAIDGWNINIQDEKLQVPMTAKGGTSTDSNDAGFTAIDETQAVVLTDNSIRKAHSALKKGAATYNLSNAFTLQIGNSAAEVWYIGDGEYPKGLDFGLFTMSGSIAGAFDKTFLGEVKTNGRADFEITFTNPANPLVKVVLSLTNVFIKYKTEPYKIGEKATLSFDWVADIHSTVSATLTNTVATY